MALTHIRSCEADERVLKGLFEAHTGVTLQDIPQGPGIVGDSVVTVSANPLYPVGLRVEFKDDKASAKYNNLYLETHQTIDGWFTTKESGHLKAANEDCLVVIRTIGEVFVFNPAQVHEIIALAHRTSQTGDNVNGNANGCFTKAALTKRYICRKHVQEVFTV